MRNLLLDLRLVTPRIAVFTLVAALCMVFSLPAMRAASQVSTGTLSGTVYDLDGTGVRATVTVTNPVSGTRHRARINASGTFAFPHLLPGQYDVETWAPGFAAFQISSIRVVANQDATLNIVLAPPSLGATNVPQEVEVSGTLTTIVEDDFENGRSSMTYELTLPAKPGQEPATIDVMSVDGGNQNAFVTGDHVTLRGFLYGNVLSDAHVERVDSGVSRLDSVTSALVSGNHAAIVLSLRTKTSPPTCTNSTLDDVVFTAPNSVSAYYAENSYGMLSVSGTVSGPYTVKAGSNCNTGQWAREADAAAAAAGVDLGAYQHRVYILPPESANQCSFGGLAHGTNLSWISAKLGTTGLPQCTSQHVYSHELGHNLGLSHSNTPGEEYGDDSSTMGTTGHVVNPHFNAPEKDQVGWISGTAIQTVSASGSYAMSHLQTATGAVKALKIPVPGSSTDSYYFSYRRAVGLFDWNLDLRYVDKTSVHRWSGTGPTYLLANLADGEFFNESGIMITQTMHDADYAYVTITLDAPPPPDTTAPAAPANLTAKPKGQKVNLAWTASSDNIGVVGYHVYRNMAKVATTTSTTYSDSTTTSGGGTYTYFVVAFDAAGNVSLSSNSVSIVR